MLVVLVADTMRMFVVMLQRFVRVRMGMAFKQVQRNAHGHQRAGDQQLRRHRLAQQADGQ